MIMMTMNDDVSRRCGNVQHLRKSAYSRASMSSEEGDEGADKAEMRQKIRGRMRKREVEIRRRERGGELVSK